MSLLACFPSRRVISFLVLPGSPILHMSFSSNVSLSASTGNFITNTCLADFNSFPTRSNIYMWDYPCRRVIGGVVEDREAGFLVAAGSCKSNSHCLIGGGVLWVGKLVGVGRDFLEFEICRQFNFGRVGTILVPDECVAGDWTLPLLDNFWSRARWIRGLSSLFSFLPILQLSSINSIHYQADVDISSFCSVTISSTLAEEEAI